MPASLRFLSKSQFAGSQGKSVACPVDTGPGSALLSDPVDVLVKQLSVSLRMAPQYVVLVRHAQAGHNVNCDWSLPDPALTSLGEQQASSIPKAYPCLFGGTDVVLTSPLRRTVQTTLLGFPKLKQKEIPLEIHPDLQETQAHPCDIGSPRSTLEEWFKEDSWLDFSNCIDGWTEKKGKYAATEEALDARALNVRRQLKRRKERVVTVVCHAGFLRHIICAPHSHLWANVEARVYRFEQSTDGTDAPLPPDNDQAMLLRVDREEELRILGGSGSDLTKTK